VAIYHLTAKIVSRGKGDSAVAAAAYQSRSRIIDARTSDVPNYNRKADELLFEGIYAPKDAPDWARDRAQLWNHVEAFEKRRDAQLARSFDIALPCELTPGQARYAVQDWVRENFTRKGLIADVAIHRPGADSDARNIHAHVLVVMRKLDGQEFAQKKERAASYSDRADELEALRESWERIGNRHLERHGFEPLLDRRSFEDRGIDHLPSVHMGKTATALERAGEPTDRGDIHREIEAHNASLRERAAQEIEARKAEADRAAAEQLASMEQQYAAARGRRDDTRATEEARPQPEPTREAAREPVQEPTMTPQAAPSREMDELAASAEATLDQGERTASGFAAGFAKAVEKVLAGVFSFFGSGEPKLTPAQQELADRANQELARPAPGSRRRRRRKRHRMICLPRSAANRKRNAIRLWPRS
jgi:hypothetical protein